MAYPGDTSRVSESALRAEGGDAELADLGRQGSNDFFNGLLLFERLAAPAPGHLGRGICRNLLP